MEIRMRALILVTGAALALAACRDNGQAGNTTNIDQALAAGTIASNDVTAIDAVTGEDSNMAADVALTNALDNAGESGGNASGSRTGAATERAPSRTPAPVTNAATTSPAETPTANNAL